MLSLDGIVLGLELYVAFDMKIRPDKMERLYVPAISLVMNLLLVMWQFLNIRQWWHSNTHRTKKFAVQAREVSRS